MNQVAYITIRSVCKLQAEALSNVAKAPSLIPLLHRLR